MKHVWAGTNHPGAPATVALGTTEMDPRTEGLPGRYLRPDPTGYRSRRHQRPNNTGGFEMSDSRHKSLRQTPTRHLRDSTSSLTHHKLNH